MSNKRALVVGIGGGGDAVSAIVAKRYLERMGYEVLLGAVVWERYVVDPYPGPICGDDLVNYRPISRSLYWVNKDTEAVRGPNMVKVVPQLARISRVMGIKGLGICLRYAPGELTEEITDFMESQGISLFVGVDAGGDVLAKGCEEGLASPLIDFVMLSVMERLERKGINVQLGVIGLGSDGELDPDYLLGRIAEIASISGLLDIKGYDAETYSLVSKVLEYVETEASRLPWMAFRGLYGNVEIRNGLRKVKVSPVTSAMFFLKPSSVAETSPLFKAVKDAETLEEVKRKMNDLGIFTEYDLEIGLFKLTKGKRAKADDVEKVRKEGRRTLGGIKLKCD